MTAQEIEWSLIYGGSDFDSPGDIIQSKDGGYIYVGSTISSDGDLTQSNGYFDVWVVKLEKDGTIIWSKNFGGIAADFGRSVVELENGDIIVGSTVDEASGDISQGKGSLDCWLIKLNDAGDLLWEKSYGGSRVDRISDIRSTTDGGIIFCGSSDSTNGDIDNRLGNYDIWVVKLDATGEIEWEKSLGGALFDRGTSIMQTIDGGYLVGGYSNSVSIFSEETRDSYVAKITEDGEIEWENNYGGSMMEDGAEIIVTDDGGFIFGTTTASTNGDIDNNLGMYDFWIVKCDNSGNIEWENNYGGSGEDVFEDICTTSDGGFLFTGYSDSDVINGNSNYGRDDAWVFKINNQGNVVWSQNYGGTDWDESSKIIENSEGQYILIGDSTSDNNDFPNNNGNKDVYVIKLKSGGTSAVSSNTSIKSTTVFPNPSSEFLYFSKNDRGAKLKATIHNTQGVMVKEINNLSVGFDIKDLMAGTYFIKIHHEKEVIETHKIIITNQ